MKRQNHDLQTRIATPDGGVARTIYDKVRSWAHVTNQSTIVAHLAGRDVYVEPCVPRAVIERSLIGYRGRKPVRVQYAYRS